MPQSVGKQDYEGQVLSRQLNIPMQSESNSLLDLKKPDKCKRGSREKHLEKNREWRALESGKTDS